MNLHAARIAGSANTRARRTCRSTSSILGLLTLAAGYDSKLTFTVTGREAAAAMRRIANLFETHFREAYD